MRAIHTLALLAWVSSAVAATPTAMNVSIENPAPFARKSSTVEIPLAAIKARTGGDYYVVSDGAGMVPSQIVGDSLLIFQVTLPAHAHADYTITAVAQPKQYPIVATGRVYPERADDMAWENDVVAFRAYGPSTQKNKEKAFGYDIFFKHPSQQPMLDDIYAAQTDKGNWHKADSLRRISRQEYNDFVKTFTYHVDHGRGFDCYAVGATLGAGTAARAIGDSIIFPWCYKDAEILCTGPVRTALRLTYEHADSVMETRTITLDAGQHLNKCRVQYTGIIGPTDIVCGFPLRDSSPTHTGESYIAYADPTQGKNNGVALLGIVTDKANAETLQNHFVSRHTIAPGESFDYSFGYAWSRADISDMASWLQYLEEEAQASQLPLIVHY